MIDVRRLLAIKDNIETAMQRDLAPHIRVFAQQQLDEVCKAIEEAHAECDKLFEPQEIDQLNQRMAELEEIPQQPMQNNNELRNDNYQLRALVKEMEASNAELLEALEKLVKFVEGSGMCFGRIHREVWERSFEVMENAREEIQKAKEENNG